MSENPALYSRSGSSCPFGKCTEEAKTVLPEETREQLTALAVLNKQSVSEYLRDMIFERVYGHIAIIHARQHNTMSTISHE